jgi:hypothetical protein
MEKLINSFKWKVFLKVMDNKPLTNWEEFQMYKQIFGKNYFQPN